MCLFKKKKEIKKDKPLNTKDKGEDIIYLKKPAKNACGGTTETLDRNAPKEIGSHSIKSFCVESCINNRTYGPDATDGTDCPYYIYAFAEPGQEGSFIYFECLEEPYEDSERTVGVAYVKEDVFPELDGLVRELGLVSENGHHSRTHGLPQDFGGSVLIRYESGEKISFSDNQAPIISKKSAIRLTSFFKKALKGRQLPLPDAEKLSSIEFEELRENGGFTKATLTFNPDGTGTNKKTSKYEDPTVYQSEKPVDAQTMTAIKKTVAEKRMFWWPSLPESEIKTAFNHNKTLTLVLDDGTAYKFSNAKELPDKIDRGFFNIELEMTTKH